MDKKLNVLLRPFYSVLLFFFFFRYSKLWQSANSKHVWYNNKRNGIARMYVTICVTYKPELGIDQLTFT